MKRRFSPQFAGLAALLLYPALAYSGTIIDVGFPPTTTPSPLIAPYASFVDGMDATGRILGHYQQGPDGYHGAFTWKAGVTTDLIPPGALYSQAGAISPSGWIAGTFEDTTGSQHVFSWHEGTFTDYPLPAYRRVYQIHSIDDTGRILGTYQQLIPNPNSDGGLWSFVTRNGVLVELNPPDALGSAIVATNTEGRIAGVFNDADDYEHAFTWSDGVFTDIFPTVVGGAENSSSVVAMSAAGQVVVNIGSAAHQAVWEDGTLTPLSLQDSITHHTYLDSQALAINASGEIVGLVNDSDFRGSVPALWQNAVLTTIPLPAGGSAGFASLVSDSGQVVGSFYEPTSSAHPQSPFQAHAFTWMQGVLTDLDLPAMASNGVIPHFNLIDSYGRIFGIYETTDESYIERRHVFMWSNGGAIEIPAGSSSSNITTIEPNGTILGDYAAADYTESSPNPEVGPFVWADNVFHPLFPAGTRDQYRATAVNSSGMAIGYVQDANTSMQHAVAWLFVNEFDISPPGSVSSFASLLNEAGRIAGLYTDSQGNSFPFFKGADGTETEILPPHAPGTTSPTPTPVPSGPTPTPMPTPALDITPPHVQVSGPAHRTTKAVIAILTGSASDDQGIQRVQARDGSGPWSTVTGKKSWSALFYLQPGRNVLRIRAIDTSGNVSPEKDTVVTLTAP